ncbi:MAG: NUDIX domain-containing protein [Patescibacteria group bacterium]
MDKYTKVAVNIFVIKDNKLLLGKRRKPSSDGFYGLPGGHLEYMEYLVDAAKRELKEETGLNANLSFLSIVNEPMLGEDKHYIHINFLASSVIGEPENIEPDKCYGWEWFPLDQLPEDIFIGHKRVISAFLNNKIFLE